MTERDLFVAALHLQSATRKSFLELACGDDGDLLARVESLLLEHDKLGSFLQPAASSGQDTVGHPDAADSQLTVDRQDESLGTVIAGKYKLIELIGEGGMGSVWRAQQSEPVKRFVAVKLIKSGMDSKAVLARFEAERQALAVMDHPNIAKILDGGVTETGSPFFVMELVKGVPITEYCDVRKLTPQQRLELFIPVCQAIQHAHQKGIIHRDIKPSNVLIALYDDRPVPKVIDFGIAKATGQALTDSSYHTAFGGVVGTPEYMSPEQASLNNLDIDTRSDVYSLGVLLYELLAGSPPFRSDELKKAGMLEMLRVVREEEPPKPSTKLSTANKLPSISANRGTEPKKLAGLLRNELDWIVMKALEKDRARRYESANGFAADVQRYLIGEAVLAHPPSSGYRLRKFSSKNKGLVLASGLVAATLMVGIAGTTWGLFRAEKEAERVRQEQVKTKEALEQSERNREQAEVYLVRSFIRPIGYFSGGNLEVELTALDELARLEDDRLKLLFLREALADGETAFRIGYRAERVIQAAIGTSSTRRLAALEIFTAVQKDRAADQRTRTAACLLAVEAGGDNLPALGEAFDTLASNEWIWRPAVGENLAERITPSLRQTLFVAAIRTLEKSSDATTRVQATTCLGHLAPHLTASAALEALLAIVKGYDRRNDQFQFEPVAREALSALSFRLGADQVSQLIEPLARIVAKHLDYSTFAILQSLEIMTPRLSSEAALKGFRTTLRGLELEEGSKTNGPQMLLEIGEWMPHLAHRMHPTDAAVALDLVQRLLERSDDVHSIRWGTTVVALSQKVGPGARPRLIAIADIITTTLTSKDGVSIIEAAGDSLITIVPFLDPAIAQAKLTAATTALIKKLGTSNDSSTLMSTCEVLGRLDSARSTDHLAAIDGLIGVLARVKEDPEKNALSWAFCHLLPQNIPPASAATATKRFIAVLSGSPSDFGWGVRVHVLNHLAPRLEPDAARKFAVELQAIISSTVQSEVLSAVASVLPTMTSRFAVGLAAKDELSAAAIALMKRLNSPLKLQLIHGVSDGLQTLLPYLQPSVASEQVALLTKELLAALASPQFPVHVKEVCNAITAQASQLDSATAAAIVSTLIVTLAADDSKLEIAAVGTCLTALAPRLNPKDAEVAFERLVQVLRSTTSWPIPVAVTPALRAFAECLDPAKSRANSELLIRIINEASMPETVVACFQTCSTLAPRLTSEQAVAAVKSLVAFGRRRPAHYTNDVYGRDRLELNPLPLNPSLGFASMLAQIDSPAYLVELLRDPGCVAGFQLGVIARLEQLAYQDPLTFAVHVGLCADPLRTLTLPALQLLEGEHRRVNRRFRTVSDVAKWLAEHHPEIDLERPYHKAAK